MSESPLQKLVRNFPENGPKLLLESPANVRDLLLLLREPNVHDIDFQAMTVERTHFVQPDYQHVALDLLLKAPFRLSSSRPSRTIFIYLLVEHHEQSELRDVVDRSVQADPHRKEFTKMGQTIAEMHRERPYRGEIGR